MYFQLHGIRQQSLENKSPLKKLFYPFYRALIERPKIYTLSLRNYSYMGSSWSQRNKDNVCDIYFIQMHIYIYIYIYIYIIHLFHALNISAIPRNKVANLKKRKQETRQNISEIWERIVDENISLLPTIFSFVQLFSGLL